MKPRPSWRRIAVSIAPLAITACVIIAKAPPVITPLQPRPMQVTTPVRAHLSDGSVIVYPDGVTVTSDSLRGTGRRYEFNLAASTGQTHVPLDSVVAMESYRVETDTGRSTKLSLAASAGVVGALVLVCVAVCGSCPTIYSADGGLEAEAFSYSIAPVFESRDVDRLAARPDETGLVELEIRNEMLETHYLNHFELLETRLAPGEALATARHGRQVAFRPIDTPVRATDRNGRDVSALVAEVDGRATRSSDQALDDLEEWIDVAVPAPAGADSVALVFHLRNSPLTTILLYEVMLGPGGAASVDWVGRDLGRVGDALDLGQWYASRMGLRVAVKDGDVYRSAGGFGDVGPLAWEEVAVVVPVLETDSVRARVSFAPDAWRIDRIRMGLEPRRPASRTVPLERIVEADGVTDDDALSRLSAADEQYVETRPGETFRLRFRVENYDGERVLLIASQGYYVEWIRSQWVRTAARSGAFRPSDDALREALRRWREVRDEYEVRFERTRFPVEASR